MFGLPFATTVLVFGFPLFWFGYLLVFLYVSRDWDKETANENDAS